MKVETSYWSKVGQGYWALFDQPALGDSDCQTYLLDILPVDQTHPTLFIYVHSK
jgi:hypothetical protein